MRGSGHKLKHRKFNLSVKKLYFTVKVVEHWSKQVMDFLSLVIFETQLDMALSNLFYLTLH